jgi:hypothetical protein
MNLRSARYRGAMTFFTYVCGATEVHKQVTRSQRKFFSRPGGLLHIYMALQVFNLHLRSVLLQFNFYSVFTSCEQTFKNPTVVMEEQKIVKQLAVNLFRSDLCA